MNFEIKGEFTSRSGIKKFAKTLEAKSEKLAREKALSLLGSEHKIKRRFVRIESVNELK